MSVLLAALGAPTSAASSGARALAAVGPMPLGEHVAWFLLIALMTFLVYSGLREEDLRVVVRSALGRWVRFLIGSALLFGVFSALSAWL